MENIDLLKSTIKGLSHRYRCLKKISAIAGESSNSKDYLDNSLGILLELFDLKAGIILIFKDNNKFKVKCFRADLSGAGEKNIKKHIEGKIFSFKNTPINDIYSGREKFRSVDNPKPFFEYQKHVVKILNKENIRIFAPVKARSKIMGILELYREGKEFGEDEKQAVISAGAQIGISYEILSRLDDLSNRTQILSNMAEITNAISSPRHLNSVLDVIMKNSLDFFNADGCSILLKDSQGRPEFVAVSGEKADILKGEKLNKGEGIVGWVLQKDTPLIVKEVDKDKRFSPRIDTATKMNTGSIICVPMKVKEDVIGVIEILRNKDKIPFNREDMNLLIQVSSHASIGIDKAIVYEENKKRFSSAIGMLVKMGEEMKKFIPNSHDKVKEYINIIGKGADLNEQEMEYLNISSLVYDLGKLTISEDILNKKEDLKEKEKKIIQNYPLKSIEILKEMEDFKDIEPVVKYHRENYDGTGYPEGLSGNNIPKLARILAIADTYKELLLKQELSEQEAMKKIIQMKGKRFDPEYVDIFISQLSKKKINLKTKKI
ncbi:MAG: HD domain-containing phosphohydrolase [Elusimicrobiota bacterium]